MGEFLTGVHGFLSCCCSILGFLRKSSERLIFTAFTFIVMLEGDNPSQDTRFIWEGGYWNLDEGHVFCKILDFLLERVTFFLHVVGEGYDNLKDIFHHSSSPPRHPINKSKSLPDEET